jgi:hypothetical protein
VWCRSAAFRTTRSFTIAFRMAWIRIIRASLTLLVDRCLASWPSARSTSRTLPGNAPSRHAVPSRGGLEKLAVNPIRLSRSSRLIAAGHWHQGDRPVLVVFDPGYDVTRLAWLLPDLPVELLAGRPIQMAVTTG